MRIIPSFIEDNSPPGERVVFASLQNSRKNWIAIHSLDLAPYNRNRRTEIDFVLVMPEYGVFCIEVKSQKDIFFDGERWQPKSIKGSPFKQALDARYAFRRRLMDRSKSKYGRIPIVHCCIFPHSNFSFERNISIHSFEVMDRSLYESYKTPDEFCNALSGMFVKAVEFDPVINKLSVPIPSEVIDDIVEFCYPVLRRKPEKTTEIQRRQATLESALQVQQKPILNLVEHNNRVVVEGGAGTGKSLIGMEVAARMAEKGLRVGYLCFNKLIGNSVAKLLGEYEYPNLVAGTVHSVLLRLMDIKVPDEAGQLWWEETVPEVIEEKLTSPDFSSIATFDYLVIDEAQDILARPALWNCVKLLLNDGLERGRFLVLGDFINQSLTTNQKKVNENLQDLTSISARWLLFENCRNYRNIGEVALTFSGSNKDTWSGYMRHGGAFDDWDFYPYKDNDDQLESVIACIQKAKDNGFKESDITLLTFSSLKNTVLKSLIHSGQVIEKAGELDSKSLRYSTINMYKGMENKVILITDVVLSPQSLELDRKIFYTGMTRATEKLYIFCREASAKALNEWIKE